MRYPVLGGPLSGMRGVGVFRLILAIVVMLGHLAFYEHPIPYLMPGTIAVEAFYIVSGFLITLVIIEKYDRRLFLFYSNRALRIYPIYWVCLLLYLLVNALVVYRIMPTTSDLPSTSALWWSQNHPMGVPDKVAVAFLNVFIIGQDVVHGGFGDPNNLFLHYFVYVRVAWSVAVEISFYAIAPFVVRRLWLVATLLVGSLISQSWFWARYDAYPFDIQLFPLALWCFMAGTLAYRAYAKLREANPRWLSSYAGAATVTVFALTATYNAMSTPRLIYLFVVAACTPGLVLFGRKNPWDGALGDLSYPLYLIHPLAIILIIPGIWGEYFAISGLLLLSWLVTRGIERPIERFRQYRARRNSHQPPKVCQFTTA
jgi:peptidoglycan/LPS O-acetylase OafA/YrhL